jgi:hypothetical protein
MTEGYEATARKQRVALVAQPSPPISAIAQRPPVSLTGQRAAVVNAVATRQSPVKLVGQRQVLTVVGRP